MLINKKFDRSLWIRFWGELILGIGFFMIYPFLSLYLNDKLSGNTLMVGLVLASSPIAALIGSLMGGSIADRMGRKPVMVISLMFCSLTTAGYIIAKSALSFAIIGFVQGFFNSIYHPAASAMVADVTKEEDRLEAYGLLRIGINVGAAVGPIVGAIIFFFSKELIFLMLSVLNMLFALVTLIFIKESRLDIKTNMEKHNVIYKGYSFVFKDIRFLIYLIAGIFLSIAYAQPDIILPIYFKNENINIKYFASPYAFLMALNGAMVVLFQMPISRYLETKPLKVSLVGAGIMFSLSMFIYSMKLPFYVYILSNMIYTIAEMFEAPAVMKFVAHISPEDRRGEYMGASGMRWTIGRILGPILGGSINNYFGTQYLFLLMGIFCLISAYLFKKMCEIIEKPVKEI